MSESDSQAPEHIFSVHELTQHIKNQLESAFPRIWVEGEISNFHRHHSGHLYFTLKDEKSQLRAVMFRGAASRIRFEIEDGMQVISRGKINVYEPRGEYQLLSELIEPKGKGALQMAFEQLKAKLQKEGLFNAAHKKSLPLFPKKVGVVTSPRGAAIIDIIRTFERRFGRTHIIIYPARVQGEGAAEEIVEGLDYLGGQTDIDVIIVGRGGGSMEDLWAFNEEIVARAVFRCPIPVISAVGHEVDFTITDFVSDIRASTPSAAAEMVIESEQSFLDRIENLQNRLIHSLKYGVQEKKNEVLGLVHHHAFQNFKMKLLNLEQRVDDLDMRSWDRLRRLQHRLMEGRSRADLYLEKLTAKMNARLQGWKGVWEKFAVALDGASPLAILKKGYAVCLKNGGLKPVRGIRDIAVEDKVTVSFFQGEFHCRVQDVDPLASIERRLKQGK
ncbi:MAG: exodeoxyribonuclease VII large subunit [Acidobacteria bacterium]|nr:exodeoxyribonuclease VII large subunit [Acidobacteriota bacterium]MBU4253039.1 exodeoxyribonuclease VII large subunit [Acidobacteriota bacterium]MBU4330579.1 exodeoxyribonuclease VII large subunit [Acidobacteriota bacterium]MCG2816228.1 exodeoxyribonuclease VII large subunit [Candidatus Aminicenantes bacterium]